MTARAPAYLIVNADDYGYFDGVSRGILDCARHGIVTATGVFANSPFLDTHAAWLAGVPNVDVGVHLNLTDGSPLTRGLGDALSRSDGRLPGKFAIATAVMLRRIPLQLIRDEWGAQIEAVLARDLEVRFLNSHEHIHMLPPLYSLAMELAGEYGIQHLRFATPEWPRVWSAGALLRDALMSGLALIGRLGGASPAPSFLGMGQSGRLSRQYLSAVLASLQPGRVYELMCHPGILDREEVPDQRLLAYHDWDQERQVLCSEALREELTANSVRLIGYRDLMATRDGLEVAAKEGRT